MIKITDIRIGNSLLLYNEVVKVTEIGFKDDDFYLRVECKNNGYYIDQFEPIELSEDTLLNNGFKKSNEFDLYLDEITRLIFRLHPNGRINCKMLIYKNIFDINHIKYLHQLQNLYWCLVGKELNIEL